MHDRCFAGRRAGRDGGQHVGPVDRLGGVQVHAGVDLGGGGGDAADLLDALEETLEHKSRDEGYDRHETHCGSQTEARPQLIPALATADAAQRV